MRMTTTTIEKVPAIFKGKIAPHIVCRDAASAIEFYKKAFGAIEVSRVPGPEGKVMHAMLDIAGMPVMLNDEFPQWGCTSPLSVGGTSCKHTMYVEDCDAALDRFQKAGGEITMPAGDQFWGDRYGTGRDPFGHEWAFCTHVEDVTPEEIGKRMAAMGG